jgi:hypothetical protein
MSITSSVRHYNNYKRVPMLKNPSLTVTGSVYDDLFQIIGKVIEV